MADTQHDTEYTPLSEFVTFRKEIRQDVKDIKDAIGGLATQQAVTGKLDGKTTIALISVLMFALMGTVTIISIVGAMALNPLATNIAEVKHWIEEDDVRTRVDSKIIESLAQGLKEVETQFQGMSAVNSLRHQEQEKFIGLLWQKVDGTDLQGSDIWPIFGQRGDTDR